MEGLFTLLALCIVMAVTSVLIHHDEKRLDDLITDTSLDPLLSVHYLLRLPSPPHNSASFPRSAWVCWWELH